MSSYMVPGHPHEVEEVIKNSQFITRIRNVASVEAAKDFIRELNATFPDATHHCWAYIVGNPQSTTLLGCSDDGEPSGTAGKPMLHVLQHSDIGDIVAVCTRFYGGTKLGTGGLARAYGGGVKLALESLELKAKIHYRNVEFELEYHQLKDAEHLIKDFETQNFTTKYQTKILVKIEIASSQIKDFESQLQNQFKGQVEWKVS